MVSNMWKAVEDKCEVCGQEIGAEKYPVFEDHEPEYVRGSTIEDEDGQYLTVCEDCLKMIVTQNWNELKNWSG